MASGHRGINPGYRTGLHWQLRLVLLLIWKVVYILAGKVLAGYENPDQDVAYPDLSVIFDSAESSQLLSNMMVISLFSIDLLHSKELKPF
jgi:hypothetical protein